MYNNSGHNNLSDLDNRYSVFTIKDLQLIVKQSEIVSIETILDLTPTDFSFETDCVSTTTINNQITPIFSVNHHLDSTGNFPIERRACLILKSEKNRAFGIAVDTITTYSEGTITICDLPSYMLTSKSIITKVLKANNTIVGVIDNLLLSKLLKVEEFYQKNKISEKQERILAHV